MPTSQHPGFQRRGSSLAWLQGLADMFESQGLDVPRLFQGARLPLPASTADGARYDGDQVSLLWELAVRWSGDEALGMDRQLPARHVNFDLLGHFLVTVPSLGAGLRALPRYLPLVSDGATFMLQRDGNDAWLVLGHTGNQRPVPRQRQEYGLLTLLTLCRWVTRREVQPLAVHSVYAAPAQPQRYAAAFGTPVQFEQADVRLRLAGADLEAPLPSRDPALLDLHLRLMDQRLQGLGAQGIRQRVQQCIVQRLHRGEPRRADIAAALATSDRTLQRRLLAEGTNFQEVLDTTRHELACKHLADARLSLDEIAARLGFGDSSNFYRASRRWFGEAPGAYRARVVADGQVAVATSRR